MNIQPNDCKVEEVLKIVVGKWKLTILFHLIFEGTKRFSELRKLLPNITQKMLTNQLRELEEQGIVQRVVYPQVPPKVEYSITEYGKTLEPIFSMMHEWGVNHLEYMQAKRAEQNEEKHQI